jgi:hypothetical protein
MSDDPPIQPPPTPDPSEGSGDASPAEPAPAPAPARRSTRGMVIAVAIGGLLVIGLVFAGLLSGSGDDSDEDSTRGEVTTTERDTTTTERPTTTAAPTTTTTLPPGFDDGIHLVPAELAPGRWMTKGGGSCFFQRLSGLGGTQDQVIGSGLASGQGIVDIAPTDVAFDSFGCERWTVYGPSATPGTAFGPGDWAVNEQIVPGTYRADGVTDCYWERARSFAHVGAEIITTGLPSGQAIVEISASDVRFSSSGCGTWTKIA